MKKNKGFTLIELLAVIVILAVIAIIATPIVLNVIENAKEKANMNSAYGLMDAGRLYYSEALLDEKKVENVKNLKNIWDFVAVSGNKPKVGELYVNENGDIALSMILDNVCYQKTFVGDLSKLKKEECGLGFVGIDKTAPTVTFEALGNSFNEQGWTKEDFYVQVNVEDQESGVDSYQWCSTVNEKCTPDAKQSGKTGNVLITTESINNKVCVIGMDQVGNESEVICSDLYKLDKTGPIFEGVEKLTGLLHGSVDLERAVSVKDSLSGVKGTFSYSPVTIDTSLEKPYLITYTAEDMVGNKSSIVRIIEVRPLYVFDKSTKTIKEYNINGPKSVVIPSSIDGVTVEKIGESAFQNKGLTNVTIPTTVTYIGTGAFQENLLTKVTVPNSVTYLGSFSFHSNQLSSVTLSSNLITIGYGTFNNNQLPDSQAFFYYRNWKGIEEKEKLISYGGAKRHNIVIPSNVQVIDSSAFYKTQLVEITIPSSVTSISNSAFSNNELTEMIIPNSVTSIGDNAFDYNQLESVMIPSSVTYIGDSAFRNNRLTSVTIPSSVKTIGKHVFNNNQLSDDQAFIYKRNADGTEDKTTLISYGGARKENVIIPNTVTTIGEASFAWCQLKSVVIPNSVTSIINSAFADNQLTSIIIPNSVTSIGSTAFHKNHLTNLDMSTNVTLFGLAVFNDNQLPDKDAFIYKRNADGTEDKTTLVSYGGARKDNIVIPNNVKRIDTSALYLTQLRSVTIPTSVTSILNGAFRFNNLTIVTIPNSVMEIGYAAFANNQLTSVKIIGKSSSSQFTVYGEGLWGWAPGYSDSNTIWNAQK